jgi:hypothetical protein
MQTLTMEQTADYLEGATIKTSVDSGYAIVHTGFSPAGVKFILVNDMFGNTVLTEAI